jgi:hypothetical protein
MREDSLGDVKSGLTENRNQTKNWKTDHRGRRRQHVRLEAFGARVYPGATIGHLQAKNEKKERMGENS